MHAPALPMPHAPGSSPPTPGGRRCAFILSPTAHARLAAVAAREGRSLPNMVQVLVLNGLGLAAVPIPSLERRARDHARRAARER